MPTSEQVSRVSELIRLLNEATEKGNLQWETTQDEDEFRALLRTALVKIRRNRDWPRGTEVLPISGEFASVESYTIEIFDASNRLIDLLLPTTSAESMQLKEFFWKIRRSALHVDQFYGALLNELKGKAGQ